MIRMNKLTDYALLVLTHVAREPGRPSHTARDLAARSRVPLPTVSKILKELARAGVLVSHRGIKGGYALARPPDEISVAQVVHALEGPIAMTECSGGLSGICGLEPACVMRSNWRTISDVIRGSLERISIGALARPLSQTALQRAPAP